MSREKRNTYAALRIYVLMERIELFVKQKITFTGTYKPKAAFLQQG